MPASSQSAVPMPDHGGGEIDHPPRHAAMGEEVAGQNEERDRHDLEALDAGEELQRHRLDRDVGHGKDECQTVRPSAMEIGMPVIISATSRPKMIAEVHADCTGLRRGGAAWRRDRPRARRYPRRGSSSLWAVRRCGRNPGDLKEAETHQVGAAGNREETRSTSAAPGPARPVGRAPNPRTNSGAERADHPGEKGARREARRGSVSSPIRSGSC